LIGTCRWTFPKETAKVGCGDDSGSGHVLNEFLVNGHSRIVSLIRFGVYEGAVAGAEEMQRMTVARQV
jgi:hypothetical protein